MTFPHLSSLRASIRRTVSLASGTAALLLLCLSGAFAEETGGSAKPKPTPDVILFSNGDQLTGQFLRVVDGTVTFHSDLAGDINVPLDKVKELRSSKQFAVLYKKQKFNRKMPESNIPTGSVLIQNQTVRVNPANAQAPQPIPFANVADIIDSDTFTKEIRHEPSIFSNWNGTITAGSTAVQATQNNTTFNGGVALIRLVPLESYLPARNRMTVNFTGTYGKVTQPGVPTTKTAIYHADSERDQYFTNRLYALGQVAFDHNFSQSLDLQQIYGGGIGWTALKDPKQQLDLKGTIQYEKQAFLEASAGTDQNLIGSTFGANYLRKLPKNIVFNQQLNYIPAWNNSRAYSANETNSVAVPVYKRLSLSVGTIDSYLNDPAVTVPPTKRNSFQFTTGVSYTLR